MATTVPRSSGEMPDDPEISQEDLRRERLRARVYSLPEMLSKPTEEANPLLGDFLRVGQVTILGGHGGQGKSTMSLEMVHAVATGGEFLGASAEGVDCAIVVDLEQGIGVAQRTVMKAFYPSGYEEGMPVSDLVAGMDFGPYAKNVWWCDWREGAGPDGWDAMFEVIEELIEEFNPALVLLDPVYKLMLGRNSNEAELVGQLVSCIDGIRSRHPLVSWLIPMHPRKPPAGKGVGLNMHDLFGAAMWSWWASAVFLLWRGAGRGATLRVGKDRLGILMLEDWSIYLDDDGRFKRSSEDADDGKDRVARGRIWDFLQEIPGRMYTRKAIYEQLGIPPSTVTKSTQLMMKLRDEGKLYRELVYDDTRSNRLLFGYLPAAPNPIIDAVKDEFDAFEEDD